MNKWNKTLRNPTLERSNTAGTSTKLPAKGSFTRFSLDDPPDLQVATIAKSSSAVDVLPDDYTFEDYTQDSNNRQSGPVDSRFRHGSDAVIEGYVTKKTGPLYLYSKQRYFRLEAQTLTASMSEKFPHKSYYPLSRSKIECDNRHQYIDIYIKGRNGKLRIQPDSQEDYERWLAALRKAGGDSLQDHYSCVKEIGSGSFGKVFLAVDKVSKDQVAVKIVKKKIDENPRHLTLMLRELRILRTIDHPNVIRTIDLFDDIKCISIVMEYAKGGTLDQILFASDQVPSLPGTLDTNNTRTVMMQILLGVQCLHQKRIVHRDLKPKNILCMMNQPPYQIKLMDFGLSNFTQSRATAAGLHSHVGSPYYIAPELLTQSGYGPPVDIWACGVIMYIIITKKKPITGSTIQQTLKRIIDGNIFYDPKIWDDRQEELRFIKKLLEKDPLSRYTASQALSDPWFNPMRNLDYIQAAIAANSTSPGPSTAASV